MREVRGVPGVLAGMLAGALVLTMAATAAPGNAAPAAPHASRAAHPARGATSTDPPRSRVVRLDGDVAGSPAARSGRGVRSWPGTEIRYWADLPASFDWPLKAALASWNRTGMHMTFVRSSKARARLRITIGDTHGADGYATIGYQRSNWVHLRRGLVKPVSGEPASYARVVAAHIIAHELGHVLGLQHTSGCELMTPVLQLPACPMMADRIGYYRRIVDGAAVKKTVARYGGRVTLAPKASPLDALPPRLGGVGFSGGFDHDAPVALSWTPPSHAPAGSKVLLLVTNGKTCSYPTAADFWGRVGYDTSRFRVLDRLSPAGGSVTPAALGISSHCYALELVNRTGAGSAPQGKVLQSWVPAPTAPTVASVRRAFDTENQAGVFQVALDYDDSHGEFVVFLARPSGQCATSWPAGEPYQDHEFFGAPGEQAVLTAWDASFQPIDNPCLTFFTVRQDGTRLSSPTIHQVGAEPVPEVPVIHSVVETSPDLYTVDATYADFVAGLAVVVRPTGECVSTWPQGQDPKLSLVFTFLDTTGFSLPCLTFFTVNAAGQTSAGVQVQTAAASPAILDITSVTIDQQGDVSGFTPLVPYGAYGIAVTIGAQGACQPFPSGTPPWDLSANLFDDGTGHGEFSFFSDQSHPCLTFYVFNWEGDLGPPKTVQL